MESLVRVRGQLVFVTGHGASQLARDIQVYSNG